ncbi:HIT domain-containing protein [bacterium]|nr:HIT domain-containing protein [bacterium]
MKKIIIFTLLIGSATTLINSNDKQQIIENKIHEEHGMKKLFAPWRTKYTNGEAHKNDGTEKRDECSFCTQLDEQDDEKYFILKRFKYNFVMLNRYPYNAGHLLIISLEHKKNLYDLSPEARQELIELSSHCTKIVQDILKPAAMNIGINLGKIAGAGMPAHLHMHILPRWLGDTNFLPVFGQTKVISIDLTTVYKQLKPSFDALEI